MSEPPPQPGSSFPEELTHGVRVERADAGYPAEFEDLQENAPRGVWMRGASDVLDVKPRVAIVGTRRPSAYGQRVTRELTTAFVRAGACIVSGLATGIDGIAHRSALEAHGKTIAVLGTGLDAVFPKTHRDLQRTIEVHGLLMSELDLGYPGMRWNFVHRNRLIAALCSLTIVVEAGERSGALITAERATDLHRDVAAVPGPIDQTQSVGANRLIQAGAQILTSVEDALALAGLTPPPRRPRADPRGDEGRVWAALADGGLDIDTLCHRSGLPAAQCMAAITKLEIGGAVECAMTGEIRRR